MSYTKYKNVYGLAESVEEEDFALSEYLFSFLSILCSRTIIGWKDTILRRYTRSFVRARSRTVLMMMVPHAFFRSFIILLPLIQLSTDKSFHSFIPFTTVFYSITYYTIWYLCAHFVINYYYADGYYDVIAMSIKNCKYVGNFSFSGDHHQCYCRLMQIFATREVSKI